jgi:hypothetical protein
MLIVALHVLLLRAHIAHVLLRCRKLAGREASATQYAVAARKIIDHLTAIY